jgi:hypothetical protein
MLANTRFFEGAGCIECGGTGYKGLHRGLRNCRPDGPDSRPDFRSAANLRDQEGRLAMRHALPARLGRRAGAPRPDDAWEINKVTFVE